MDAAAGEPLTYALSPNPNHGDFTFQFTADEDVVYQAEILDFTGKKVWSESRNVYKGDNAWSFNNLELNTGYYMLRLQTPRGISIVNFVTE